MTVRLSRSNATSARRRRFMAVAAKMLCARASRRGAAGRGSWRVAGHRPALCERADDLGDGNALPTGDVDVDVDGTAIVAWAAAGDPVVRRCAARRRDVRGDRDAGARTAGRAGGRQLDGRRRRAGRVVAQRHPRPGRAHGRGDRAHRRRRPAWPESPSRAGRGVHRSRPGARRLGRYRWGRPRAVAHASAARPSPLPDLAPGPGNLRPRTSMRLAATPSRRGRTARRTRNRRPRPTSAPRRCRQAGRSAPPEDVATAVSDTSMPVLVRLGRSARSAWSCPAAAPRTSCSPSSHFQGPAGRGRARREGRRADARAVGRARRQSQSSRTGRSSTAVCTSPTSRPDRAGDALYVEGFKPNAASADETSPRAFAPRVRPPTAAPSALRSGAPGRCGPRRWQPSAAYLVLMRSGASLRSRAGNPASGFGDPLVFSGTDARRLLGLAGAPNGLAAAAWLTTSGRVHAAIYDDRARRWARCRDRVRRSSRLSRVATRFAVRAPHVPGAPARGSAGG